MIEGSDTDYELFQYLFCEETHRVELKFEITDAMTRHELVWTDDPAWDLPVHARCCETEKKNRACKCVVPLGTVVCPLHKRPLIRAISAAVDEPSPVVVKKKKPVVVVQKTSLPAGMPMGTATSSARARWLPTPTTTTRAENAAIMEEEQAKKRAKPLPKPMKKPEAPLVVQDNTFKYKLDDWSRANTTWEGRNVSRAASGGEPGGGVVGRSWQGLSAHYATYNDEFHGPRVINGVKGYRRAPDGKFQPTQADVNILGEDGTLTPDGGGGAPMLPVEAKPAARPPVVKKKMIMSKKEERMAAAGRSCQFKLDSGAWAKKRATDAGDE